MRQKPRGISAAAVLAGGISRHGTYCACPYCAPPVIPSAYQRPIVEVDDQAPLNPPVELPPKPVIVAPEKQWSPYPDGLGVVLLAFHGGVAS